ncbi:hypothetical protein [Nitrospira sp. BLG_2]|uniref:hypothetical protein n=1 Tax=Nitrospira sp. BLG_2 TaxID=3397507 RepID=UPI003B9BD01C
MKMSPWYMLLPIFVLSSTALSPAYSAETKLLFRAQGASIPAGKPIALGKVEVALYSAIRIVVTAHPDSNANAVIELILMEGDEQYLTALDTIVIPSKSSITRLYPVPGRKLLIQAATDGSSGSTSVDVIVYGTQ